MAFKPARKAAATTSNYRGEEGRKKADRERERSQAKADARKNQPLMPFRYRLAVGETAEYIICDEGPDFFRFEHTAKNPATGRFDLITGCVKEHDNCGGCEVTGKESYYAMYLTVIDLREFTTRSGDTEEFSRKLYVVKPAQQKKFQRMYAKAEAKGGSLRGALVEVTRDGEMDASIGNEFELIEYVPEEDLQTYVRSYKDKEGKKHTEKCYEPFDYEALFPEQTADEIRALFGAEPTPGSRAHETHEIGSRRRGKVQEEEEGDAEDEGDWEKDERPARMRPKGKAVAESTPTRGRRRAAEPEEPEEDEDEEEVPATPRGRQRRGATSSPVTPSRRGRAAEPEEPEEDEDEEDEAPVRKRRRAATTEPAPARARRAAAEPEDDEEDDVPVTNRRNPRRVTPRGRG